jgi:predicted phage terminase large subunit-like protein
MRGEVDRLMLLVPPRHGKALALDTLIPTPSGWSTIGGLAIGDIVFDETGKRCRVIAKSPVWKDRPVFNVETDDGDVIVADADHEWLVRLCRKNKKFKLKTTHYLALRKSMRAPMINAQGALDLPEAVLPVDPYVLGVWLGDGRTNSSGMCSADQGIIDEVSAIEGGHNNYANVGITQHFRIGPHYRHGAKQADTLQGRLRTLGLLGNKHVPDAYKRSSASQRLSCLQGLIDTDGSVSSDGQIEFCSKLLRLAEDVKELVASLGHKASIIEGRAMLNGVDYGTKYRVMFYMKGAARLPRKAIKSRHGKRAFRRYISVTSAGIADTVCIEVDSPSHMFLCGKSMLPTHNSELASRRFPALYLGHRPDHQFISVSATADFAADFGRDVRNTIASQEYRNLFPETALSDDSSAKNKWHTSHGGVYISAGVESQIMGRGAHVELIDDPFPTMAAAQSATVRKGVIDYYRGTLYNRLMPGGSIILINHRMHEEDLTGYLLEQQAQGGDQWRVVEIPAIDNDGQAAWPEDYPIEALERIKRNMLSRDWNSLYQQRPAPEEGNFFKREWLQYYDKVPENVHIYGASDYAVTDSGGDFTVHVTVAVDYDGNVYILDVWREQKTPDVWIEAVLDLMEKRSPLGWAEENGQIIKSIGPFLDRRAQERGVYCMREQFASTADKPTRARTFQARMASGKVFFPRKAPWLSDMEGELLSFPAGKYDDQVDALSLAFRMLADMTGKAGLPVKKDQDAWDRAFEQIEDGENSWKTQ